MVVAAVVILGLFLASGEGGDSSVDTSSGLPPPAPASPLPDDDPSPKPKPGRVAAGHRRTAATVSRTEVVHDPGSIGTTTTAPPAKQAVDRPGGCEAVDAALRAGQARRRASADAGDPASRAGRLQEGLMTDSPVEGLTLNYDGPETRRDVVTGPRQRYETDQAFGKHGFVDGHGRNWQSKQSWTAIVEYVYEFADAGAAVAFDSEAIHNLCDMTTATFDVPDVPGAFGLTFSEASSSRVTEQVSFSRGARRYTVLRLYPGSSDDHTEILKAARQAAALAR